MANQLLVLAGITVRYGRMTAVRDVSLSLPRGSAAAIVGPNGAGKSTILAAIAGGVKPVRGDIVFDGVPIVASRPEAIAVKGVSLVPEGRHVFATMSVRENLLIGSYMRNDPAGAARDMEAMLELFPRLCERFRQAAGKLSGGEQQMLVIARALMTRPKLLLIDEPSLGLAPRIVDEVYEVLRSLRATRGLTLLINEQTSKRVLRFAETIHVLREGEIRLSGSAEDLRDGTALTEAYFGSSQHHSWAEELPA
ncbi:branched-chain amino acid transport system ATP-binding protein [Bradyrhizobium sp. USDA 4449]